MVEVCANRLGLHINTVGSVKVTYKQLSYDVQFFTKSEINIEFDLSKNKIGQPNPGQWPMAI